MRYQLFAVGSALLVSSCGSSTPDLIPVTFQSKWFPQAQFIGYYAAGGHPPMAMASADIPLMNGMSFYEAEGLDVTVLPGGSANPSEVVATGTADFGTDWIANMVRSIESNNYDLVHLAQVFQRPGYEFVALRSSNIETVSDFAGHRVGVWAFGNEFPALVCLSANRLTSDLDEDLPAGQEPDVTTETYAFDPGLVFPPSTENAMSVDVASAMVYNELNQIRDLGFTLEQLQRIPAADAGCGLLEDFIFTTAALLENPNFRNSGLSGREVATRFVRATIRGWTWAVERANEQQALNVILDMCGDSCAGRTATPEQHQLWQLQRVSELVQPGLLTGGTSRTIGCLNRTEFDETLERLQSVGLLRAGTGANILRPEILTAAGTTCP